MENLLFLLAPLFVSLVTSGVKWLGATNFLQNGYKKVILRFLVALLSFGSVVGGTLLTGGEVDPLAVETFVQATTVFFAASGVYFFSKSK